MSRNLFYTVAFQIWDGTENDGTFDQVGIHCELVFFFYSLMLIESTGYIFVSKKRIGSSETFLPMVKGM